MENKSKLNDKYNPKDFEQRIYENWEKKGYFKAEVDKNKKPYTIVIPPPNITGKLHMGHALDDTLQDILIRYKRMDGYSALWLPGSDHASIATEAKIVAKLKEEGTTKNELGREKFLERAWEWKEHFGGTIQKQIKKIGCSCDWSRERFTLDEGLTNAVKTVFVNLYEKGYIYKGEKMVNWCPYCDTSISDAEVEFEEADTHLWHISYKTPDGKNEIIVATTRPETMLGDTAVAVHPEDERYKDLVGKTVVVPIVNREIPVIADEFVEKEFGTGAVKITPAHDPNDYEAGLRHNLEVIEVFDEKWNMNDLVAEYKGLSMLEARELIVEKLKKIGALVKVEDYKHNVGKCYRCHHTIEPKISEQWFVRMKELAQPAIEVVKSGEIKFVPERFEKTYMHWMENTRDWCISRRIWWGHRIPAYYCQECGEINVAKEAPEQCKKCGSTHLVQDEDTLDTWFSSALWPFSTLGWPEKTEDYEYFYPTNTLVTGYDIIGFWVSRMIFSALEHTGKKPFDHVLIHGIVRDSQGRKMSKSLGNGIDPLEIIDQYGADSLRFSLILNTSPGNDIRYMPEKLEAASNFANKLWNVSKFVLMHIDGQKIEEVSKDQLQYADKWILNKLNVLKKEVKQNLDKFELGVALQKIYEFIWDEFCDWYIEMAKTRLYAEGESKKEVLYTLDKVLADSLKLLHPFMPFITEEIYSKLRPEEETIMLATWPNEEKDFYFEKEAEVIEKMKALITEIRNVRSKMKVVPSKKTKLIFVTTQIKDEIKNCEGFLEKLGFANEILVQETEEGISKNAVSIILDKAKVFIPLEDLVDLEEEKKRLEEEKKKIVSEIERAEKMLANPGFTAKAPEQKVQEEKQKLEKYKAMLVSLEERMSNIGMN